MPRAFCQAKSSYWKARTMAALTSSAVAFSKSSLVSRQVISASVGFTPLSCRFQKGEFTWWPWHRRVTTGTFRSLHSFPNDSGSTAVVPQRE